MMPVDSSGREYSAQIEPKMNDLWLLFLMVVTGPIISEVYQKLHFDGEKSVYVFLIRT